MYHDGFTNIVNIDYSPVVIENMRNRCKDCTKMKWEVMDINNMKFPENEFDIVLEKGTFDSLLVEEKDPWRYSWETANIFHGIMSKVCKILWTIFMIYDHGEEVLE